LAIIGFLGREKSSSKMYSIFLGSEPGLKNSNLFENTYQSVMQIIELRMQGWLFPGSWVVGSLIFKMLAN